VRETSSKYAITGSGTTPGATRFLATTRTTFTDRVLAARFICVAAGVQGATVVSHSEDLFPRSDPEQSGPP